MVEKQRSGAVGEDAPKRNDYQVIVTEIDDEVLLYETPAHRAHCLTREAYRVLVACDGRATPAALAASLGLERPAVDRALAALRQAGLVLSSRPRPDLSRRRAMKKLAVAAAVPVVWSIIAPSVAQAASTVMCIPASSCGALTVGQCCGPSGHNSPAGTCVATGVKGQPYNCAGGGACGGDTCQ